jgi:hypothetical protein
MDTKLAQGENNPSTTYRMRLQGNLTAQTFNFLEDITITLNEHGEILLVKMVIDQATLRGLLDQFSSLNLTILPIERIQMDNYQMINRDEEESDPRWISADSSLLQHA